MQNESEKKKISLLPSQTIKAIPFLEHYIEMDQVFEFSRIKIQIFQGIMIIVEIALYFMIDGKELVYAMYIPFDIILKVCTMVFFWFYYFYDQSDQEDHLRVAIRLNRMDDKKLSLQEPLVADFNPDEQEFEKRGSMSSIGLFR